MSQSSNQWTIRKKDDSLWAAELNLEFIRPGYTTCDDFELFSTEEAAQHFADEMNDIEAWGNE